MSGLLLAGCGGSSSSTRHTDSDSSVDGRFDFGEAESPSESVDGADANFDTEADASLSDSAPESEHDAVVDSGKDAGCDYLDLQIWLVACAGSWAYLRHFSEPSLGDTKCPPYYRLKGITYSTQAAALSAGGCDGTCLLKPSKSVSFVHCGKKNGYIVYASEKPSCPSVYAFSTGLYSSEEEWAAANPCK